MLKLLKDRVNVKPNTLFDASDATVGIPGTGVLLNVVKDSCEVLFATSCETAALWKGMDNGGNCASILLK